MKNYIHQNINMKLSNKNNRIQSLKDYTRKINLKLKHKNNIYSKFLNNNSNIYELSKTSRNKTVNQSLEDKNLLTLLNTYK